MGHLDPRPPNLKRRDPLLEIDHQRQTPQPAGHAVPDTWSTLVVAARSVAAAAA